MTLYSYDAAYPPTLGQLAAGSPVAVACYLTAKFAVPSTWPAQIRGRGWVAVANYEEAADELVTCGRAGGQQVGARAMAAAERDGFPAGSSIFYSVDVNVPASQFPQVGAAFDGINDVTRGHYCTHVYGEGALIDYLVRTGRVCVGNWLSASASFPGYNPQSPNVGMYQLAGASPVPNTDQNIITNLPALHAWGSPTDGALTMTDISAADAATVVQAAKVIVAEHETFDKLAWAELGDANNAGVRQLLAATLTRLQGLDAAVAAVKAELDTAAGRAASGQPVDLAPILAAVNAIPDQTAHTLAQKLGA